MKHPRYVLAGILIALLGAIPAQAQIPIDDIQFYDPLTGQPESPYLNQNVTIEGVITVPAGIFHSQIMYIQDATGGVMVFDSVPAPHTLGDRVRITGPVYNIEGEIRINASIWTTLGPDSMVVPVYLTAADVMNDYENIGMLARLDATVVSMLDNTFMMTDATDTASVLVSPASGIDYSDVDVGDNYTVVGPVTKRYEDIRLKPRFQDDLVDNTPPMEIVINEVLFNPTGPDSTHEWVELVNIGETNINLAGWGLTDAVQTTTLPLPNVDLPAGAFLVVRLHEGTDDLDFSDGCGIHYANIVWPLYDNDSDACILFSGSPKSLPVADCVAWSALGAMPGGAALADAISQGEWASGQYLNTAWGGNFVSPWVEGGGESIGRNSPSTDTNGSADWSDHGGSDAMVATPMRANRGPVFQGPDLCYLVQESINQFLWEFGLNIESASYTGFSATESAALVTASAYHSFGINSRFDGGTGTMSGNVTCQWEEMGFAISRWTASGILTSTRGLEQLEFSCTVGDSAMQFDTGGREIRSAQLTYASPDGDVVTRNLDFTATNQWTDETTLQTTDSRSWDDSRGPKSHPEINGVCGTRVSELTRWFPNEATEEWDANTVTTYSQPVGAPKETMEFFATKTTCADGSCYGTGPGKKIKVEGRDILLRIPSTFSYTRTDDNNFELHQTLELGNPDTGYMPFEIVGQYEFSGDFQTDDFTNQQSTQLLRNGEILTTLATCSHGDFTPGAPAGKSGADKAWYWTWNDTYRVLAGTGWAIVCTASVAGGPACVAAAIATDIVIERMGEETPPPVVSPPIVELPRYPYDNYPGIHIYDGAFAQSAFPFIGTLDWGDLGNNSVRFDMVRNIAVDGQPAYQPGDSLVFDCVPREGAVLADTPRLVYELRRNSLFDPYRFAGWPDQGYAPADSVIDIDGDRIQARYAFDLPDEGFLFPGDVLHYYVEMVEDIGGEQFMTQLPADTSGFSIFPGDPLDHLGKYPETFVFNALPSVSSEMTTPTMLVVYKQPPWLCMFLPPWLCDIIDDLPWPSPWPSPLPRPWPISSALQNLGYEPGLDFDVYFENAGSAGWDNGLGTHATVDQIAGYQTIIYCSGPLEENTMSSYDLTLFDSWLQTGGKNLILFGDHLASDLNRTPEGSMFLSHWMSVSVAQADITPLIGNQTKPTLADPDPGDGMLTSFTGYTERPLFMHRILDPWWDDIIDDGTIVEDPCGTRDAILLQGAARAILDYTDPSGGTGTYPYPAMAHNYDADTGDNIFFMPIGFSSLSTLTAMPGPIVPLKANTWLLGDILTYCGNLGSGIPSGTPDAAGVFSVGGYPNPFNPSTKIVYNMPRRGELSIAVYNIRGQLVKTLFDDTAEAGSGSVSWKGTDDNGRTQASGVYFCRTKTLDETRILKLVLLK